MQPEKGVRPEARGARPEKHPRAPRPPPNVNERQPRRPALPSPPAERTLAVFSWTRPRFHWYNNDVLCVGDAGTGMPARRARGTDPEE